MDERRRHYETKRSYSYEAYGESSRDCSPARRQLPATPVKREKPILLFSNRRSSCSYRVRIALNLKQIQYEIKPVRLEEEMDGDDYTDELFEFISPLKHVPALHIDNHTLIGSLNMLLYLEETRPHRPLLPGDPMKRAKVREICELIASGVQPLQYVIVLDYVGEGHKIAWAQYWIERGFRVVEKILAESAGNCCIGDTVTLADCCLVPQMHNARLYNVNLTPFPTMVKVDSNLQTIAEFKDAHPDKHPERRREEERL